MQEFIKSKRYWIIGTIISIFGVLVAKAPNLLNMPNNKYFAMAGYFIALLGLFFIALNIKKK